MSDQTTPETVEPTAAVESQPVIIAWRDVASFLLAVVAAVLVPLGAVGSWAGTEVVSTSGFVQQVGPLSAHPDVQQALTATVTDRVVTSLQQAAANTPVVGGLVATLIPQLAGPISDTVNKVVTGDSAERIWTESLTSVHDQTVRAIRGEDTGVDIASGTATLDLNQLKSPIVDSLSAPDAVKGLLGNVNLGSITIETGVEPWVLAAGVQASDMWLWLLIGGAVLAVLAALVARRPGRGFAMAGGGIAAVSVLAWVGAASALQKNQPTDPLSSAVSTAIIGSLQSGLSQALTYAAISGLVLLAIGAVVGLIGLSRRGRAGGA